MLSLIFHNVVIIFKSYKLKYTKTAAIQCFFKFKNVRCLDLLTHFWKNPTIFDTT